MADKNNPRPLGDNEEDNAQRRQSGAGGYDDEFEDEFGLDADELEMLDGEADDFDEDLDDDELDDDLDDDLDDFDDDELDDDLADLSEFFQGDDYRIVSLNELSSLDDIVDEGLAAVAPTMSLEELLYNLVREVEEVAVNELAVLADLSRPDIEQTRRAWPQVPLMRRRAVVSSVVELFTDNLDLDFGGFLRIAVDDSDSVVQRFAVTGLAEEGASVDLLGRYVQFLLAADDIDLRAAAAAALGPYILDGELEELDAAMAMRAEQALMAVLTDPQAPALVQAPALESIAYSGELGVRQLIEEAYYSPDEVRRLSSLVAMGRSADVRWRRMVRAELTNPDPSMRAQAAYACGELETKSALPDLLKLLTDRDQQVRLAAMFALSHIGGPQAREALLDVQATGDEVEAFAAEQALEELDFYAGAEAASTPLYDETADDSDDEDWEDQPGWEDDSQDGDLGEYE
jgi:hypothetical protein